MTKHAASVPGVDLDDDDLDDGAGMESLVLSALEDDDDEQPATTGAACIYCECTEDNGCETDDGPCSWVSTNPPVCSAPDCVAAHARNADMTELDDGSDSSLSNEEQKPEPRVLPISLGELREIPIGEITPDPDQPRETVDDELADSIAANGVLNPITVRMVKDEADVDWFMIVDGERRYRGAKKAGLETIPARVVADDVDAGDVLLRQVVFNEGKRLTPMEEAKAWKRIMTEKSWTAQQLAKAIGRGKSTVSDRLALLDAPEAFHALFMDGTLSAAAAPIVRKYSNVPAPILAKIIEHAGLDSMRADFAREGKTIPLHDVEDSLKSSLGYPFPQVTGPYATEFTGQAFEIGGKKYAADYNTYQKHLRAHEPKAPGVRTNDDWQKKQAEQRARDEAKREREAILRRAQVLAINAKLPAKLTAVAWQIILAALISSANPEDVAELGGIALPTKKSPHGAAIDKLIDAHVKKLSADECGHFALQLILADHLEGYARADELKEFAKLTRVDLKKIKPPAEPKAAAAPAKPSPAKSTSKKRT